MKKIDVRTVITAILIVVAIVVSYKVWNNNITNDYRCAKCGGYYKVVDYISEKGKSSSTTKAIIQCKDCGNVFKVSLFEASKIETMYYDLSESH